MKRYLLLIPLRRSQPVCMKSMSPLLISDSNSRRSSLVMGSPSFLWVRSTTSPSPMSLRGSMALIGSPSSSMWDGASIWVPWWVFMCMSLSL